MFERVILTDFLSFGPGAKEIPLRKLNILVGPNGAGKSNFVEALALLRAIPRDLPQPIRLGGGVDDWLYSASERSRATSASVEVRFEEGALPIQKRAVIRYQLTFGSEAGSFVVLNERVEDEPTGNPASTFYYGYEDGRPMLNLAMERRELHPGDLDRTQSILSQRRDPDAYPEVSAVGDRFREIMIYRAWGFGPNSAVRLPCSVDLPTSYLMDDFSNLPARISALKRDPELKRRLLAALPNIAPGFTDIEVPAEGGRLRLYLAEGNRMVPAHRLSDGTLRYLCLLAILLDPGPARLVVIEEPELGLHPDLITTFHDLLLEASERVQLVVTTHSTVLVDTFTDHPECILVVEKDEMTTQVTRLDSESVKSQLAVERWREDGSLGALWLSGAIGGTRW